MVKLVANFIYSFETKEIASEAMKKSQGFPLFEKPMDIQYALEPSFAVTALSGSEAKLQQHKNKRKALQGKTHSYLYQPKNFVEERSRAAPKEAAVPKRQKTTHDELPPNTILFLQNLAAGTTEATLISMFKQFQGFKEVRLVPGKADIAFVEYDTELESGVAKQSLHGYRIGDREMKVTFAKK